MIYRAAMIYRAIRGYHDNLLDPEYEICTLADCIHSPSVSLAEICLNRWKLNPKKVKVTPNVFQPSQEFLKIPPVVGSSQKIFFGGSKLNKLAQDILNKKER